MNIKKYIVTLLVVTLLLGGTFTASAETTSTTSLSALQALIQSLQAQVTQLMAQIATLQQYQNATSTTATSTQDLATLIANLREGSTGESVKILQALLAADPSIYPEGKITGFFGRLTANAIKRYQKQHGIAQSGKIEKKTIEELKKDAQDTQVKMEDRDGEKKPCAMVPPGHLIAPGWLRKMGGVMPIVPECQTIPRGIEQDREGENEHPTTTPSDMNAPVISQISTSGIATSSAQVTWMTDESATSVVWYSTSTPVATSTAMMATVAGLSVNHAVMLPALASSTTYYYVVVSADAQGNTSTSSQYSFVTLAQPIVVVPPVISAVMATSTMATSTHITWVTDMLATSMVWYSTSTPVTASSSLSVSDSALVLNHDVTLPNLVANTPYYYLAVSSASAGNTATSTQAAFQTPAQ